MARLLKQSEAKKLGLPGRTSLEPVSGEIGSRVTFPDRRGCGAASPATRRAARIATTASKSASMCCAGTGVDHSESGQIPIKAGRHRAHSGEREATMTVNTGTSARCSVRLWDSGCCKFLIARRRRPMPLASLGEATGTQS